MFGNENSDTKYAWKAKYEQAMKHNQGLQARIFELNELIKEYEDALNKLIKAKKELEEENLYFANVLEEKEREIQILETGAKVQVRDSEAIDPEIVRNLQQKLDRLKKENEDLMNRISELQRSNPTSSISQRLPESLASATQKLLMREIESDDERYTNAFIEFVESLTIYGDPETKILATLIKYGGKGPKDKLREKSNVPQFEFHLSQLVRKGYLKEEDQEVMIDSKIIISSNEVIWSDLSLPEMFETLKNLVKAERIEKIPAYLAEFRDELQQREVPATTVFFAIRKLSEAIKSQKVGKGDILSTIDEWAGKILAGNP